MTSLNTLRRFLGGYNQLNEKLVEQHELSLDLVELRLIVGTHPGDEQLLDSYPLTPAQARLIGSQVGVAINPERVDYFLEAMSL